MVGVAHASLLGAVVELADPTFYLAIILTAWCPFKGLRSMRGAAAQRFLILLGATGAVALDIMLARQAAAAQDHLGIKPKWFDLVVGISSVVILVFMGFKALCEFWSSPESDEHSRDIEYGKKRSSRDSHDGTASYSQDRLQKKLLPLALFTTFIVVFAGLPDGRWEKLLYQGDLFPNDTSGKRNIEFAIGTGLGFVFAIAFAILCGSFLQGTADQQRMRFMITCSLWALVLWTGSGVFLNFHRQHMANDWREDGLVLVQHADSK